MTMTRRMLLTGGALAAGGLLYAARGWAAAPAFTLSDAQWRARLNAQQYAILRKHATERAFTHPLNREKRPGIFLCAGCALPLFSSRAKYDSGTGWPSFTRPLSGAVGTSIDYDIGVARTEVHCIRCDGHLGHVFNDGPAPTGKRYCINGGAMAFRPGQTG